MSNAFATMTDVKNFERHFNDAKIDADYAHRQHIGMTRTEYKAIFREFYHENVATSDCELPKNHYELLEQRLGEVAADKNLVVENSF